jgi:hypothetical protein
MINNKLKNRMEINKAIEIIEKDSVYKNINLTDKTGFFIAVNDPNGEVWEWSHRKILKLAEIVKTKPESLKKNKGED